MWLEKVWVTTFTWVRVIFWHFELLLKYAGFCELQAIFGALLFLSTWFHTFIRCTLHRQLDIRASRISIKPQGYLDSWSISIKRCCPTRYSRSTLCSSELGTLLGSLWLMALDDRPIKMFSPSIALSGQSYKAYPMIAVSQITWINLSPILRTVCCLWLGLIQNVVCIEPYNVQLECKQSWNHL